MTKLIPSTGIACLLFACSVSAATLAPARHATVESSITPALVDPHFPRKWAYEATAPRRAALDKGAAQMRRGHSLDYAIAVLGPPDDDRTLWKPRIFGATFGFRVLTYDLKLVQLGGGNNYDERINLYFDENDRLTTVERSPDPKWLAERLAAARGR